MTLPAREAGAFQTVDLRHGWHRPPANDDRLYDADDFASLEDNTLGKRRFAPAAPSIENRGELLSEARWRYEREWATELADVEGERTSANDASNGGIAKEGATPKQNVSALAMVANLEAARQQGRRSAQIGQYITKDGNKPIPKGIGRWRVLGRP